jgi:hypothetical protein
VRHDYGSDTDATAMTASSGAKPGGQLFVGGPAQSCRIKSMALPGWDWLTDHLSSLNATSGGYETMTRHTMNAGAVFAGEVILVVAWLIALPFLLIYSALRAARRRKSRGDGQVKTGPG